jgi:hypothetical protein
MIKKFKINEDFQNRVSALSIYLSVVKTAIEQESDGLFTVKSKLCSSPAQFHVLNKEEMFKMEKDTFEECVFKQVIYTMRAAVNKEFDSLPSEIIEKFTPSYKDFFTEDIFQLAVKSSTIIDGFYIVPD